MQRSYECDVVTIFSIPRNIKYIYQPFIFSLNDLRNLYFPPWKEKQKIAISLDFWY